MAICYNAIIALQKSERLYKIAFLANATKVNSMEWRKNSGIKIPAWRNAKIFFKAFCKMAGIAKPIQVGNII